MEKKNKDVVLIQLANGQMLSKYIFIDILGKAFSRDTVEKLLQMLSKSTHILMKENSNVIEMLTVSLSSFPLPQFHKVEKKISHISERPEYSAIGRWNENWVVGGKHLYSHYIKVLSEDLKLEAKYPISHAIYCLIIVQDIACLGCQHGLKLLDLKTSSIVEFQKIQQPVMTILPDQRNQSIIISVSGNGIVQVVDLNKKVLVYRVKVCEKVNSMVYTSTPNKYAFATNKGVIFGILDPQQGYKYTKDKDEAYFDGQAIDYIAEIDGKYLVITSHWEQVIDDDTSWGWRNEIQYSSTLIDRETKKDIKFSDEISKVYSMQQVKGRKDLLMAQMNGLCFLDIKNLKVTHLYSNGYFDQDFTSTFCQVDNGSRLQIGIVSYDKNVSAVKVCSLKY
ncbi:UNKNOWN [Stylonychia lemnae]|uniref:Uncharacterized protein n=1 Tax=Stylonychia lemnae TaxID=5949 RepID=A0A078A1E0_STYLE|nr:UNKNOWN [Stylonychia lemnae]|eukprot:CDW75293.1 UNKNOWN [Stylonychia lemnae]